MSGLKSMIGGDLSVKEEWRQARWMGLDVADRYWVSSSGRVRSMTKRPRELRASKNARGYLHVCLTENSGRRATVKIHRLVVEVFIGALPKNMTVNHIDGNKENNNLSNLEIVSNLENCRHAHRTFRDSHVEFRGKKMALSEAIELAGNVADYNRAYARINRHGWDVERAISTAAGPTGRPRSGQWAR